MSDETEATPKVSWLTRDQCIGEYNFDPTGYSENVIKSQLRRLPGGHFQRVWLEDAVVAKIEELNRKAGQMK